ncbi:MAG TPA: alpha-amylase [Cytophagaceae bacterium]|jgi:alpha-amylase|nr:alpha-amylase [Cytophagaceae bacterium]
MYTNETLFESFHWYYPADGSFWNFIASQATHLKDLGITLVWLPPAVKTSEGPNGVGYSTYDLYDLGEFDQKGAVRTKYGTKEEYINAVNTLKQNQLKVISDVVLNHRLGADEKEKIVVYDPDPEDRNKILGEPHEQEVWTKFTFPGRQGKYSAYIWDFNSFTGVDDEKDPKKFYLIRHEHTEGWDEVLGKEHGNFDYLLGADVEFRNPAVREELKKWIEWFYHTAPFDAVRLDAVKHMNIGFINELMEHLKSVAQKDMMVIAELWTKWEEIKEYMELTNYKFQIFDAPLHYNFEKASKEEAKYDLRCLLNETLMQQHSELCISLVDNHDTQPLQTLESSVKEWFQPLAHAFILLRREGIPCIFYPHLFGCQYSGKGKNGEECQIHIKPVPKLSEMLQARKDRAYGEQRDYFDHPRVIGWTREGVDERPDSACAVLLSNDQEGYKDMEVGKRSAGKIFIDLLGNRQEEIRIDDNGWARFTVNGRSVSVWGVKV